MFKKTLNLINKLFSKKKKTSVYTTEVDFSHAIFPMVYSVGAQLFSFDITPMPIEHPNLYKRKLLIEKYKKPEAPFFPKRIYSYETFVEAFGIPQQNQRIGINSMAFREIH